MPYKFFIQAQILSRIAFIFLIDSITMKTSMIKKNINKESSRTINQTISHNITPLNLSKAELHMTSQIKSIVQSIQNQLRQVFGYQITVGTIQFLSFYYEYHELLVEVINHKLDKEMRHNTYLNQFTRAHSEEHVSKIFNDFVNKGKLISQTSKYFRYQCLSSYFGLQSFTPEKIVKTLVSKIVQAKREKNIDFEELRMKKRKKTQFFESEKENKVKNIQLSFSKSCRKIMNFNHTELYYSILALKVMLSESNPNVEQMNQLCQQIKNYLANLLHMIKLKQWGRDNQMKQKTSYKIQ